MDENTFEIFKKNAEKNRMFIRASRSKKLTATQKKELHKALKRSKKAHEKIYIVQKELERAGSPFVIFKTFNNHPDMGEDVDILVDGDTKNLTNTILKKLNGRILDQSIASDLAGKVSINIEDSPVLVEFHKDRFSQIGEHMISGTQIIKNSRLVKLFGKKFRVPSYEDEILITVIHRIYRHMSLRFSDVYNVNRILEEEKLDWAYILENAEKTGILPGLLYLLTLTKRYGGDIENLEKFPHYISKRDFIKIYFGKIYSDLINIRIGSLLRLVTIYPSLLLLQTLFGKRFENTFW